MEVWVRIRHTIAGYTHGTAGVLRIRRNKTDLLLHCLVALMSVAMACTSLVGVVPAATDI